MRPTLFDGIDNKVDGSLACAHDDCAGARNGICVTGDPGVCSAGAITCQSGAEACVVDHSPLPYSKASQF